MGNLFTARVGNILTVPMGNVLTARVGKVLVIYMIRGASGKPASPRASIGSTQ